MTVRNDRICRRVTQLASAMLDGRLDAGKRAALQRHLHGCPECTRSVQELARLGRATHNLPRHRITAGMATRVRAAMQTRRGEQLARLDATPGREGRGLRILAAAALLALAWAMGFWMRGTSAARHDPTSTAAAPDATFAATSRRVLSDLAWVPELPTHTRRPLLTAQLDLFDLRSRAARVLWTTTADSAEHELARLVLDLARSLEAGAPPNAPEEPLRATHAVAQAPPEIVLADRGAVQRVVERHAEDLTRAEREDLGAFLQFKRELVLGEQPIGAEFVRTFTQRNGTTATGFALATGFAGARDLADAGLGNAADELQARLRTMLRAMDTQSRR